MIYPDVSLQDWLKKYQLTIETKTCANCGKNFETTVPILIKGYAGLETTNHGCPFNFSAAIFTPITDESKKAWLNIITA